MKVSQVIALGVIVGCAAGIGTTWAKFGWATITFDPVVKSKTSATVGRGKVVVDAQEHDFGTIERESIVQHAFHLTNTGDAPLKLEKGGTTCLKCTIADLPKNVVGPGESIDIVIQYHALAVPADFRQTATLLVQGDPDRRRVELTVFGKIATSFEVRPTEIVFNQVAADQDNSVDVQVVSFVADNLEVLKHEFLEDESAASYEAQVLPMPADQLEAMKAKSGKLVRVTAKHGLPLGPLRQKLRLETNLARNSEIEIPIRGIVGSDISVVGKDFNPTTMTLRCGVVKGSAGAKYTLFLLVRGPEHRNTQFPSDQIKVEPDFLRATFGEPAEVNGGTAVKVPLVIEIPPGSPTANHLGGEQGELAHITLGTTHPVTKEIRLFVQFAVDNQNR